MKISVVLSTYNRCESLAETLASLAEQKVGPEIQVEVLIINNNSTDKTKEIAEDFCHRSHWPARHIFEPKQGISRARNRGIKEAAGDYLIFTDDDVLFCDGWLQAVADTFATEEADCVSGKITPKWSNPPFQWIFEPQFQSVLRGVYVCLDHGPKTKVFKELDYDFAFGANMAFSKKTLGEVGGFREDLGMKGNKRFYGEETDLLVRCFNAGKKIVYSPEAAVLHKIPQERLSMKYIRNWRFSKGLDASPKCSGNLPPFWLVKEYLQNSARAFFAGLSGNKIKAIEFDLQACTQRGQIVGILKKRGKS